jgi:hypothetical protein
MSSILSSEAKIFQVGIYPSVGNNIVTRRCGSHKGES